MTFSITDLIEARRSWGSQVVVATNGCFDILHVGHIRYLEAARQLGDRLIVGLNSDHSVTELKGPTRPINPQYQRAEALNALRCVDDVCIFNGMRCVDFLIAAAPNIYVKGGDYTEETMDRGERAALNQAQIVFVPLVLGASTSNLIRKLMAG